MILRPFAMTALLALLAAPVPAQSTAAAFVAADVHSSPHRTYPFMRASMLPGSRYAIREATMVDLIASAYDVDPVNVFGGPTWLEFDRFNVYAKVPPDTPRDAVAPMLRSLLADRFGLVAHTDTKPVAAYVLSTGKAMKLKASEGPADADGCRYQPSPKDGAAADRIRFACHNITLSAFAGFLQDTASPYLNRPVVDATGLKGTFDCNVEWSYEPPHGSTDGLAIFAALEKQLGLKLELKTAPMPVVVVDRVNEKPTPNVEGLEKVLPPQPAAQFEVAVIRPSGPDEKHFNIHIDESGRVTLQYTTIQNLIAFAWDFGPGKIQDKPKWLDDQHFDILGRASVDASPSGMPASARLDPDDVKEMVRTLLADRFKMASHLEDRPATAFLLIAANPRMKKADPANHPSCKEGPGADGKDPRLENPVLSRLISCQNMTMGQFTQELQDLASGYVPAPVIDSTGLEGAYDFSVSFSRSRDVRASLADGDSDPSGAISLFDALNRQLGLKLEKKDKAMVPMLVIDHIEPQPTDN